MKKGWIESLANAQLGRDAQDMINAANEADMVEAECLYRV